jgi:hypothetical protein
MIGHQIAQLAGFAFAVFDGELLDVVFAIHHFGIAQHVNLILGNQLPNAHRLHQMHAVMRQCDLATIEGWLRQLLRAVGVRRWRAASPDSASERAKHSPAGPAPTIMMSYSLCSTMHRSSLKASSG